MSGEAWYDQEQTIRHRGKTLHYQRSRSVDGRLDRIEVWAAGIKAIRTDIRFDPGVRRQIYDEWVKDWYDKGAKPSED